MRRLHTLRSRPGLPPYAVLGSVCLLALTANMMACAVHRTPASSLFIRQGKPAVDLGGPVPARGEEVTALRELAARARPRAKSVNPEMVEARDAGLRTALSVLAAQPSSSAELSVAIEYRRAGIADAAYQHASAAIRLDDRNAAAYDLRARLWRSWGLPGLGLADARKAVGLAPRSATAWNTYGLVVEGSGDRKTAIRAYLRATRLDRDASYAWSNLCRSWTAVGEDTAAVSACHRAIDLDPAQLDAQVSLAEAERHLARRNGSNVEPAPDAVSAGVALEEIR